MKRYFLIFAILVSPLLAKAESISFEAWCQLRDIHAWHLENVDKVKWDPKNAYTDAFLSKTLKPYFFTLVEENNRLTKTNATLSSENINWQKEYNRLKSENARLHSECDSLRTKNNIYFFAAVVLLILFGFLILAPIIFLLKRKKVSTQEKSPENACPRCGSLIDFSKKRMSQLRNTYLIRVLHHLVSLTSFYDKWSLFLLVSKPYFLPQSLCPRANT